MNVSKTLHNALGKLPARLTVSVFFMLLCQSCFKDIPSKIVIYNNDFETDQMRDIKVYGNAGIVDSIKTIRFNGSKILGNFNNNLVFLDKTSLPTHNALRVEFDLYIHDKWEGDYVTPGYSLPDLWTLVIDGFTVYLATFSNGAQLQSFPNKFVSTPSTNKAHADAWTLLPGICAYSSRPDGTAMYKIDYTTAHSGDLHIILADLLQGQSSHCTKSWSIDNLRITAINYTQ